MKKTVLAVMISVLVLATGSFAALSISDLTNDATLDTQLDPLGKVLGTGLNTGIYAPMSSKIFTIGIQNHLVTFDKEGVFSTLDLPGLPIPVYGYVGVRVPMIGISGYLRGLYLPVTGLPIKFLGFGVGYDMDLLALLNIKAVASYNMFGVKPAYTTDSGGIKTILNGDISYTSYSLNVFAAFTKIPLVKPYAFLGASINTFKITATIDVNALAQQNLSYDKGANYIHMGLGVSLLKVFTLEGNLLPKPSASLSVGFAL